MSILTQAVQMVSTPPGGLVYHMVLVFALGTAASLSLSHWIQFREPASGRMALAAGGMLLGRAALMAGAALAWIGVGSSEAILPPLDRGVAAITLWLLIWTLAFPRTNRPADVSVTAAVFFTGLALAISLIEWAPLAQPGAFYNSQLQETFWAGAQLAGLALGLVILLVRRPPHWGLGLAVLLPLLAGHAAHLAFPMLNSSYPGPVRLAELAAIPLVTFIAQRRAGDSLASKRPDRTRSPTNVEPGEGTATPANGPPATDPRVLLELASLAGQIGTGSLPQSIVGAVARAIPADLCLLLSAPDENDRLYIQIGFDLRRELLISPKPEYAAHAPALTAAIRKGVAIRLYSARPLAELSRLCAPLALESLGPVLLAPIPLGPQRPGAIAALSPYSQREWTADDANLLGALAAAAAEALCKHERLQELEASTQLAHPVSAVRGIADMQSAIDAALARLGNRFRSKGILLRINLPEELPQVRADPEAVSQILVDLLTNASEVSRANGEVAFTARRERSRVDGTEQEYLLLSVRDSGDGARPEAPAVGSALARVRSLVAAQGGRLRVESGWDGGNTISILLPIGNSSSPGAGRGSPPKTGLGRE